MTKREGPMWVATSYQTCSGCKWWDHYMVRSGLDPIYENQCMHPTVKESELSDIFRSMGFYILRDMGRQIGRSDHTPDWCPAREGKGGTADDGRRTG